MLSVFEERKFDRNNTKNKTLTIYSNLFSLLGRDTNAHECELQKKLSLFSILMRKKKFLATFIFLKLVCVLYTFLQATQHYTFSVFQ